MRDAQWDQIPLPWQLWAALAGCPLVAKACQAVSAQGETQMIWARDLQGHAQVERQVIRHLKRHDRTHAPYALLATGVEAVLRVDARLLRVLVQEARENALKAGIL